MPRDSKDSDTTGVGPELKVETRTSDEYRALEDALKTLQDGAELPPQDDPWRVLGSLLAPDLRDRFQNRAGVEQPADTACIRRLITGEEDCSCADTRSWVDREREQIGTRNDPPHQPPHADHAALWLDGDGEPAVYSMHIYPGNVLNYTPSTTADPDQHQRNGWFDIVNWAEHWGLEVDIAPISWYNPFRTVTVLFYPPERNHQSTE
ncbi:hypothetical protein GCM10027355_32280 [Haloplanus salinarum]|uniref:hypothetical protein n=1 Tax=Haloplanus salinarum TaxID=1912324 RepID=UPI003B4380AF